MEQHHTERATMEFHHSRQARDLYRFDESLFTLSGNVLFANFHAARVFAQQMNERRDLVSFPEQAVRAGHYPAVKLGPPWWLHDSIKGMKRYLEQITETAGLYNTVGFNDDTRAFPSIPARHDLPRRIVSNWLAGLVLRGFVDTDDARETALEASYGLAKRVYRFSDR